MTSCSSPFSLELVIVTRTQNEVVKRSTRVVGIFPNDAPLTRLVGVVLVEQDGLGSWRHTWVY